MLTSSRSFASIRAVGPKAITTLAFHPNGKWLASGDEDLLILWDFAFRKNLRRFKGHYHPLNGLAFSPDGRRLANVTKNGVLRLWDVESTEELFLWRRAGSFSSVAFNHDGTELIAGHHDRDLLRGGVSLWWAPREKSASTR